VQELHARRGEVNKQREHLSGEAIAFVTEEIRAKMEPPLRDLYLPE